ncbi:hypothetical protein Dsin_025613 [Dipteronia sinensis]|uniref:pectinesterase n=1 Tax=Dipteronia sinensis TaxID=43782 RepID=A0AAD9ZXJ5_9ROSI|nr:hypothetical protein Dsin_025613 [Dipteronia sinensis]
MAMYSRSSCTFTGTGKAYLGRAYVAYSRVIIFNSTLSDIVISQGWEAWNYKNQPQNIVYADSGCSGPVADTSKRVFWEKKLSAAEMKQFVDISYID